VSQLDVSSGDAAAVMSDQRQPDAVIPYIYVGMVLLGLCLSRDGLHKLNRFLEVPELHVADNFAIEQFPLRQCFQLFQ
jgi:hypothetical protein